MCDNEGVYEELTNDDCDDSIEGVHPDNPEYCSTPFDDNCDGEINEALEKWNAEEEKKRKFEATWNRAHALAIESKEQNRSDQDGSNTSADYYGDGSSWSNSSSMRRGKGSTTSGLGGRTK